MLEKIYHKFENNLNEINLLRNKTIKFKTENSSIIEFSLPTLEDFYNELDFLYFMSLLKLTPEDIEKNIKFFKFKATRLGTIIRGIINRDCKEYSQILLKYFKKYVKNFTYKNNNLYVNNNILTPDHIEFIVLGFLVALHYTDLPREEQEEDFTEIDNPEIKKFLERQRAAEEKVKKVKERKRKSSNKQISLDKIILSIMVTYNLKFDDVIKMNFYQLYWYFKHIPNINLQQVNTIAAGNGLLKKYENSIIRGDK